MVSENSVYAAEFVIVIFMETRTQILATSYAYLTQAVHSRPRSNDHTHGSRYVYGVLCCQARFTSTGPTDRLAKDCNANLGLSCVLYRDGKMILTVSR